MSDNNKSTSGFTNENPPIVPVKLSIYTHSYTAFIGGASDKYSFAPNDIPIVFSGRGLGPNRFVGEYYDKFVLLHKSKLKNASFQYYGYEEAYNAMNRNSNKLNAFEDIKSFLEKHPQTQVNLIGHSLGGWNAAGLAQELANKKICKVNLLITIDPVGEILSYARLTSISARIYFREPSPSFNYWISLTCDPKSYDSNDAVADSGGQWRDVPKSMATVFHITQFSHADFDEMMKEKIIMQKSAEQGLLLELEKIK